MKINSALPSVGKAPDASRPKGPTVSPARTESSDASERVDISSLSARLQEVGGADAQIDVQRVAEIKQAISEGRFQINPERIADGLLSSVRDMLKREASAG